MTVKISKPAINVREKLSKLDKPTGQAGLAILAADTPTEQFELINAGRKNLIINPEFVITQRGYIQAATSDNGVHAPDRWYINNSSGTSSLEVLAFTAGQTEVPYNPRAYLRMTSTIGNDNQGIHQRVENVEVLAGRTVTLSFWAKGTNPTGGYFHSSWIQDFGPGGSASVETLMDDRIVLTPNWKKYTITTTVPSIAGKTYQYGSFTWVDVLRQPYTDSGTDGWTADIASVQLEFGAVATPLEYRSYGEELALCQRYFYATPIMGAGVYNTDTQFFCTPNPPVTFRTTPSITTKSGVFTNINVESSDLYDISSMAISHNPNGRNPLVSFGFPTRSAATGYGGVVAIDQNDDEFFFDAEI